jgi:hypothetical protein
MTCERQIGSFLAKKYTPIVNFDTLIDHAPGKGRQIDQGFI